MPRTARQSTPAPRAPDDDTPCPGDTTIDGARVTCTRGISHGGAVHEAVKRDAVSGKITASVFFAR